jgi:hypothetical protein
LIPAGKDHNEQLPRLQNEFYRRLDGQVKLETLIGIHGQVKQHGRTPRQIAPLMSEINDEATFSAADAHMTSAQMRTRGVPGTPCLNVGGLI